MSSDSIDDLFSGLDNYYPGSKKRRLPPVKTTVASPETWGSKPVKKYLPNGSQVDMFTIGALSEALGRPIITLRSWMNLGYLPEPPYRLPDAVDKHGEVRKGRRLYTRPMIEVAVDIFSKYHVLYTDRIEWSKLKEIPLEIADAWDKIRANEMNPNKPNENTGE